MMKKIILLATALSLVLGLAACSDGDSIDDQIALYNASQNQSQKKKKAYPFYHSSGKFNFDLPLYFLDGVKDLPYIESDYMLAIVNLLYNLVDGPVDIKVSKKDSAITWVRKNETYGVDTKLTFDFDKDVIRFDDYNLFMMKPSSSTILDVTSVKFRGQDGNWRVVKKMDLDSEEPARQKYLPRYGEPLEINLAKYGIDIAVRDGKYLVPLQTFSDIFVSPNFLNSLYFNGKSVLFASDLSKQKDPAENEYARSVYYAGEEGERSAALAKFGYGELCMALDLLYGLKEQHGIESFDQLFQSQGAVSLSVSKSIEPKYNLKSWLTGASALDADMAIYHLIGDFLDDNHAKWWNFSYLAGVAKDTKEPNGAARARLGDYEEIYKGARDAYYSIDPATGKSSALGYHEEGDTAFVTFDSFEIDNNYYQNPELYYTNAPSDFPANDTIGLIMKAHAEITRDDTTIKNVVIDLSANTGGAADTAVFVAAWFLGEATISMKHTATGALCSTSYRCDANRDKKFDADDTLGTRRLFCLVSPVSFSCGNLVPSLFRVSEKVTLLGKASGGGACVVQPISSAWGTSFRISGPGRLCYMKNGSYYDIDQGARPDHTIDDPNFYYSGPVGQPRKNLVDYINSLPTPNPLP